MSLLFSSNGIEFPSLINEHDPARKDKLDKLSRGLVKASSIGPSYLSGGFGA